jgi:hypothetical protein
MRLSDAVTLDGGNFRTLEKAAFIGLVALGDCVGEGDVT